MSDVVKNQIAKICLVLQSPALLTRVLTNPALHGCVHGEWIVSEPENHLNGNAVDDNANKGRHRNATRLRTTDFSLHCDALYGTACGIKRK